MSARLTAALDTINAFVGPGAEPSSLLVAAKCRGLMRGYHARWNDAPLEVEAAEYLVTSDLWNPETGRKSRSFTVAGKIDARVRDGERVLIVDHKTTSQDVQDANAPFWRQLVIEGQPSHYMLLEWLNGRKVDGAVWDVVKKPGIAPKNVAKGDEAGILASGRYFGTELSEDTLAELRQTHRENLEMYEARLAWDCTHERPQWYFQRRPVARLDSEIHEYAVELWEHGQELLHARNMKRFARNSGACMMYGSPCEYLGICSGHDTADSDKWKPVGCVHRELSIEGDGRDVLTNSRIRCFQTCRRKEYYHYQLGIDRQDEAEREALYFGSCWHAGQEAWWRFAIKGELNGNASGAPAIEVGIANDTAA